MWCAVPFPTRLQQVFVLFDYEGMQDGQNIVWKTFVDGEEEHTLRTAHLWNLGARGKAVHCLHAGRRALLAPRILHARDVRSGVFGAMDRFRHHQTLKLYV